MKGRRKQDYTWMRDMSDKTMIKEETRKDESYIPPSHSFKSEKGKGEGKLRRVKEWGEVNFVIKYNLINND